MGICGIYYIQHIASGRTYVGSSYKIEHRWRAHKTSLQNNRHRNKFLQSAWNKYGAGAFQFSVVAECSRHELFSLEQMHLERIPKKDRYNFGDCAECPARGYRHTSEAKRKIAAASKQMWEDPLKAAQHADMMRKEWTDPLKRKTRLIAHKNAFLRSDTILHLREGARKRVDTPEIHMKMIQGQRRWWDIPSNRDTILKKMRAGKTADTEKRRVAGIIDSWQDPIVRERHRASSQKVLDSPEYHEALRAGQRARRDREREQRCLKQ
jgi:group I intron endonuclease